MAFIRFYHMAILVFICYSFVPTEAQTWTGSVCQRPVRICTGYWYCICYYRRWGCSWWRWGSRCWYGTENYCCSGYRERTPGNRNCQPYCSPSCKNDGTCIAPNKCSCKQGYTGDSCEGETCSERRPCYPGDCITNYPNYQCQCDKGFRNPLNSTSDQDWCLSIDPENEVPQENPQIGNCTAVLSYQSRLTGEFQFEFITDATLRNDTDIVWSNQDKFNHLRFEFKSNYYQPDWPKRPLYVHDRKFGVIDGNVFVNISKIPRDGGEIRFVASTKTHTCSTGATSTNPMEGLYTCVIEDPQFVINIEHGDWFTALFTTTSGGFRTLSDGKKQNFFGQSESKTVEFRFDLHAPVHCSEEDNPSCAYPVMSLAEDFTKKPIEPSCQGWDDPMSGLWRYYVEFFKLTPDPYGRLTEATPINPLYSTFVNLTDPIPTYTPDEPGMYSVLLKIHDMANNSRIARRLALYDPNSEIELNEGPDAKLYVSSAVEETGYMWQTETSGQLRHITVTWNNHFANKIHEDGKLLNSVLPFPTQFADIEADGILQAKKYVNHSLDDHDGDRTVNATRNWHGIIRFEVFPEFTDTDEPPPSDAPWTEVLGESYSFQENLNSGRRVKIWVRAHDVMGNTKMDSTEVHFDDSVPVFLQSEPPVIKPNVFSGNSPYVHTSELELTVGDVQSGVYKFHLRIIKEDGMEINNATIPAYINRNANECSINPTCTCVVGTCFLPKQQLPIDNCWFLMPLEELESKSVIVEITAFNQAQLTRKLNITVSQLNTWSGLEKYYGPENIRVIEQYENGVKIGWDLPNTTSCFGRADIVILVYLNGQVTTHWVHRDTTTFSILGLDPDTEYRVGVGLGSQEQLIGSADLTVKTAEKEAAFGPGAIVGVVVGILVIIGLLIAILVVLLRRGKLQPVQRQLDRIQTVVRRKSRLNDYSNNVMKRSDIESSGDDLYLYGGMDFNDGAQWNLSRDDITFESLITSGHFANIYKARLTSGVRSEETVVAKTLKDGYTANDKLLMTAKINFSGTQVGKNPNVLEFIGAVTEDEALGPFIIYEYCEMGTLNTYLQQQKNNVTVETQEHLYRFGLQIARGLEYLASKKIVHRRLAARNILLTVTLEAKIAGFGPQPAADKKSDGDGETGKKERIPIKWMAPECMKSTEHATHASDVWSYGVVLWEIFSLGEQPYPNIRGRDLPDRLKRGERLNKPEQCDDTWYGVMRRTWNLKPEKRPTIKEIRDELDEMFVTAPGQDDYYYAQR